MVEMRKGDSVEINVENVKVGKVFKNYSDMCEQLGLNRYVIGSIQYKCQMKWLNSYFKWERVKGTHKILVTRVFSDDYITLIIDKDKQEDAIKLLKEKGFII